MSKKALTSVLAGAMLTLAGFASAAEPIPLSEAQMDAVSAGTQSSTATGSAFVLSGTASVRVTTSAYSAGPVRNTQASALSVALGFGSSAKAAAGSTH